MARRKQPRLTDDQIVSICESEIDAASGWSSGELSEQRADAMDFYLGEPYGDEIAERSSIVTREVLDTIEAMMPSMMRIFAESENLITFEPVGPEDEEQAEQESDAVSYVFWKQNNGFHNLYTAIKDGLVSKTGCLKVWWDENPVEEREEYHGLDEMELGQLLADTTVEREIIESESGMGEDGFDVVFKTVRAEGQIVIEPIPPEEVGVNRDARSPWPSDCSFIYQRNLKTIAELIEAGYDRDVIDRLGYGDDVDTEERLARRHLTDEQDGLRHATHPSMRSAWVTECYLKIDRDDDGIAELLKVTLAAGIAKAAAGARLLDIEEVDKIPLHAFSPVPLTHKFYGLSWADLTMDLQRINSTLLRGILDNTYLSNNQRLGVNGLVNLDDAMTSRPGGLIRTRGETPPGQSIFPIPAQPIPPQTYELLEELDDRRKRRTGVGDEVAALDSTALSNVNTGVAALAFEMSRSKLELVARIVGEYLLKPLFRDIHELLSKHQTKEMMLRLRNQWVPVNPGHWRHRENLTVAVGIGQTSRERRIMALGDILERQEKVASAGGAPMLVNLPHMHKALADYTEALGLHPEPYWQDPMQAQQPEQQPDPQMLLAQGQIEALQGQNKIAEQKNQVELFKAQASHRMAEMAAESKAEEMAMRERMAELNAEVTALRANRDESGKIAKLEVESAAKERQDEIKALEIRLKDSQESTKREVEIYKAVLSSSTALTQEQLRQIGAAQEMPPDQATVAAQEAAQVTQQAYAGVGELQAMIHEMREAFEERDRKRDESMVVERDESGRAVRVGGRNVSRDGNGLIVSIG